MIDIEMLNSEERRALSEILKMVKDGNVQVINALRSQIYEYEPVDMETFLSDTNYLGLFSDMIYPKLREDMIRLFSGDYFNVILTGAIGYGKSTFASFSVVRFLYEILILRNPQRVIGMVDNSTILFLLIAPVKTTASTALYDSVLSLVSESPFFKNFQMKFDRKDGIIEFPEKRVKIMTKPSNEVSYLGLNVICCVIDEGNFYGTDKAETIYDVLYKRIKSRFYSRGRIMAKIFLLSSKRYYNSFVNRKIKELKDEPGTFILDYSLWDVKRDAYSNEVFYVFTGSQTLQPKILDSEEEIEYYKKFCNDEARIIEVPVDFRRDFEKDIYGALRDLAGVSVASAHPFITQDALRRCYVSEPLNGGFALEHPFEQLEIVYRGEMNVPVIVDRVARYDSYSKSYIPLLNPMKPRAVHIDLGLRHDATGIAMAHIYDVVNTPFGQKPIVCIDFMLKVVAEPGSEVSIEFVRRIVYRFMELGYQIKWVTLDSFQSFDTIQTFKSIGLEAETLSTEKIEVYKLLKDFLVEGRVKMYYYEPFVVEINSLEYDSVRNKVDHPKDGSKDVVDAVAGCIYNLVSKVRVYSADDYHKLYAIASEVYNPLRVRAEGVVELKPGKDVLDSWFEDNEI